jgi:hypothetical protein
MGHPRYSTEEIVRRGEERYEQEIRPRVEEGNKGKILIIDIETGEYEIDDDQLSAAHRALAKHPGAALFGMRIGFPALGKIGGGWGDRPAHQLTALVPGRWEASADNLNSSSGKRALVLTSSTVAGGGIWGRARILLANAEAARLASGLR